MRWQVGTLSSSHPSFGLFSFFRSALAGCALCQVPLCSCVAHLSPGDACSMFFGTHSHTAHWHDKRGRGLWARTRSLAHGTHISTHERKRGEILLPLMFFFDFVFSVGNRGHCSTV